MYKALSPHAIGVRANTLEEAIAAARLGGFEGVEFNVGEVADRIEAQGVEAVVSLFSEANVIPAGWGLPIDWRGGEARWRADLQEFPRLARAAAAIGGTSTMTWIMPASDETPFEENLRFHVERFTPIAEILDAEGCRLGLEFIGTKTLRDGKKYPFIHTLDAMLEMGSRIGPNVGLLLDCWHWYASHGKVEDIRKLRPEQVVYVHVNDAPADRDIEAQLDNIRALPGETGVIDIAGFLQALQSIGYDGPVAAEPFKKELKDLPSDEERLRTVGTAMDAIFKHLDRS